MRTWQRAMVVTGLVAAAGVGAAWKSAPVPTPPKIATADVLGVVERMILSDRYRPAQEAFTTDQNNKLKPMADELVALENRGNGLPAGSPEIEPLRTQFDQKRQAFQTARQEALAKIDAFNSDQVREAYRLTLEAIDEIAAKQGYTTVLASRTGPAKIMSDNVAGALQEILARPVAKADPGDDLTERLIAQFRLEGVKLDEAPKLSPVPAGAGPGPTAPGNPPRK